MRTKSGGIYLRSARWERDPVRCQGACHQAWWNEVSPDLHTHAVACECLYILSVSVFTYSLSVYLYPPPPHTHTQGLHTHALTINTDINIQCTKPPWSWSEDTLMLMQAALRALTRLGVSWRLWGTVCKFIVLLAQPGSWQSQNPGELFLLALGSQLHGFSSKTSSS